MSGEGLIERDLVDGRYTVLERIGKGAMGVVYKCHDTVLDRVVAIKQMVGEIDDDAQLRQRFTQEARSAARLNHPNIITIYELHESDGELAIVMELLEGVSLATLIKRTPPLPLEARLNMMAQVCDGLDFAHKAGIIHRDIKPANLHVSPAGVVKILDFGIARLAASKMTSTGGLIGTPDYMSPEQVMAGTLDARSDLFAVGAVLYELLCGSKPFAAESITALLMKIVREPHVPLEERAPDVPVAARDLVERLLAKDPDDRPASAREVQEALVAISTERPLFDAKTVASLSTAVTEETLRPRTPRPPGRSSPSVRPAGSSGRTDSSAKLASLALERGRGLRQSGDLAGAMKVFRSVLELAPGNTEALAELEEMERAIAHQTAVPGATAALSTGGKPGAGASRGLMLAVAAVLLLAVAGGAWMFTSGDADEEEPVTLAMPALPEQAPVPAAPQAAPAPATASTEPVPAPAAQPPAAVEAPRVTPRAAASAPPRPEPVSAVPSAPIAAPVTEPPPPVAAPPPPPEPAKPAVEEPAPAVVRHYHGRSLRRGLSRGYCDGTLQLLPDGIYFRTTTSSDGRKDDKKVFLSEIDDTEIEDDRLFIETDEQNWEFGAAPDLLRRIQDFIKTNRKKKDGDN